MPGHPDKMADQISDAVLDMQLELDANARVALETLVTNKKIIVAGEVNVPIDYEVATQKIRHVIEDTGYTEGAFNYRDIDIEWLINTQSRELNSLVNSEVALAGDQSIVFGYATNDNDSYVSAATFYANCIIQDIYHDTKSGVLPKLGPDGKMLVNIKYHNDQPVGVHSVVLSLQHNKDTNLQRIGDVMFDYVQQKFPEGWLDRDKFYFNPSGSFINGGPEADTGLTGRKIIVDSGGAGVPHGGGAFSGKDCSKIDRSGAYMARYLAKNVVVSGIASKCMIKMVYFIGMAQPIMIELDTLGTALMPENVIVDKITSAVDLTPTGIINHLNLRRPIYRHSSVFGHFGRPGFPWEEEDLADILVATADA